MASLRTCSVPYCRFAGIVLLDEKILSNIPIDSGVCVCVCVCVCVKAFIHIALACK